MRYRITGANRDTGEDVTIEVNAVDKEDAGRQAIGMNLLVAMIDPVPVEPQSSEHSSPTNREGELSRTLRAMKTGVPPDYFWLKLLGHIFNAMGLLTIGLTVLFNLMLLLGMLDLGTSRGNVAGFAAAGGIIVFINMLVGVLFGAIILAIGQALLAFRDIARNSWKLPQLVELMS